MSGSKRSRDFMDDDFDDFDDDDFGLGRSTRATTRATTRSTASKKVKTSGTTTRSRAARFDEDDLDTGAPPSTLKATLKKAPARGNGVYWDRGLTVIEKVERKLRDLGITRHSVADVGSYMKNSLADLFDVPVPAKKRYAVHRRQDGVPGMSKKGAAADGNMRWAMEVIGPNKSKILVNFRDVSGVDIQSDNVRRKLGDLLERFYNAFGAKYPIPTNKPSFHVVIAVAALEKVDDGLRTIEIPNWQPTNGLYVGIPYFDEVTNAHAIYHYYSATGIELTPGLQTLPLGAKLYRSSSGGGKIWVPQTQPGIYETCIPDDILDGTATSTPKNMIADDPQKLRNTEDFMSLCSWKMSGLISSKEKMKQLRQHLEQMYIVATESRENTVVRLKEGFRIYRGHPGATTIKLASSFQAMISGTRDDSHQLHMNIISPDGSWAAQVLEYGRQSYLNTGIALDTIIDTARFITKVNASIQDGQAPPLSDTCSQEMQNHVVHKCHHCHRDVLCCRRQRNSQGVPLCQICYNKDYPKDAESLTMKRARLTITKELRREAKRLKQDFQDKDNRKILADAVEAIKTTIPGSKPTTYTCGLTNQEFDSYLGFHPMNQTIDAALPAALDHRGQNRGHVHDNLLGMPQCANMAKTQRSRNIPADVGSVSEYRRKVEAADDENDAIAKENARVEVMRACDNHNVAVAKFKLNPASAEGFTPDPDIFEAMKAELVAGKVCELDQSANEDARKAASKLYHLVNARPCAWDEEEKALVQQYGNDAGVQEWSDDGAPWPFPECKVTAEFKESGWDMLFTFVQLRLIRMDLDCNRHWITIDTELSLTAEILRQLWLKSEEFLELPISPFTGHALMMSVGHKVHGKQMRTGYSARPATLSEWDEALSNILIETAFSNLSKMEWPEKFYPDIKNYMAKIRMPKQFFDADLELNSSTLDKVMGEEDFQYTTGVLYVGLDDDMIDEINKANDDSDADEE